MRGKGQSKSKFPVSILSFEGSTPGVYRAATQYGVAQRIIDLCTFDITNHPWRCGGVFDAIITDPPCVCIAIFLYC